MGVKVHQYNAADKTLKSRTDAGEEVLAVDVEGSALDGIRAAVEDDSSITEDGSVRVVNGLRNVMDITPNDSTDLTHMCGRLYITVAGNLKVDMEISGTVTIAVGTGFLDGLWVRRVYATGTTATGIKGFY